LCLFGIIFSGCDLKIDKDAQKYLNNSDVINAARPVLKSFTLTGAGNLVAGDHVVHPGKKITINEGATLTLDEVRLDLNDSPNGPDVSGGRITGNKELPLTLDLFTNRAKFKFSPIWALETLIKLSQKVQNNTQEETVLDLIKDFKIMTGQITLKPGCELNLPHGVHFKTESHTDTPITINEVTYQKDAHQVMARLSLAATLQPFEYNSDGISISANSAQVIANVQLEHADSTDWKLTAFPAPGGSQTRLELTNGTITLGTTVFKFDSLKADCASGSAAFNSANNSESFDWQNIEIVPSDGSALTLLGLTGNVRTNSNIKIDHVVFSSAGNLSATGVANVNLGGVKWAGPKPIAADKLTINANFDFHKDQKGTNCSFGSTSTSPITVTNAVLDPATSNALAIRAITVNSPVTLSVVRATNSITAKAASIRAVIAGNTPIKTSVFEGTVREESICTLSNASLLADGSFSCGLRANASFSGIKIKTSSADVNGQSAMLALNELLQTKGGEISLKEGSSTPSTLAISAVSVAYGSDRASNYSASSLAISPEGFTVGGGNAYGLFKIDANNSILDNHSKSVIVAANGPDSISFEANLSQASGHRAISIRCDQQSAWSNIHVSSTGGHNQIKVALDSGSVSPFRLSFPEGALVALQGQSVKPHSIAMVAGTNSVTFAFPPSSQIIFGAVNANRLAPNAPIVIDPISITANLDQSTISTASWSVNLQKLNGTLVLRYLDDDTTLEGYLTAAASGSNITWGLADATLDVDSIHFQFNKNTNTVQLSNCGVGVPKQFLLAKLNELIPSSLPIDGSSPNATFQCDLSRAWLQNTRTDLDLSRPNSVGVSGATHVHLPFTLKFFDKISINFLFIHIHKTVTISQSGSVEDDVSLQGETTFTPVLGSHLSDAKLALNAHIRGNLGIPGTNWSGSVFNPLRDVFVSFVNAILSPVRLAVLFADIALNNGYDVDKEIKLFNHPSPQIDAITIDGSIGTQPTPTGVKAVFSGHFQL